MDNINKANSSTKVKTFVKKLSVTASVVALGLVCPVEMAVANYDSARTNEKSYERSNYNNSSYNTSSGYSSQSSNVGVTSTANNFNSVRIERLTEPQMTEALREVRAARPDFRRLEKEALLSLQRPGLREALIDSPIFYEQLNQDLPQNKEPQPFTAKDENGNRKYFLRYYYDNGRVLVEAETNNRRVLNGNAVTYFENGAVASIVSYVDGVKDGYFIVYDMSGRKIIEGFYKNNLKDSLERRYYPNGNIEWESEFKQGLNDGPEKYYDENGVLKSVTIYEQGVKNGWSEHYRNGVLDTKVEFIKDKPSGAYAVYNPDGSIQREVPRAKAAANFENAENKALLSEALFKEAQTKASLSNNTNSSSSVNSQAPRDDGEYVEMLDVSSTDKAVTGAVEYIPTVHDERLHQGDSPEIVPSDTVVDHANNSNNHNMSPLPQETTTNISISNRAESKQKPAAGITINKPKDDDPNDSPIMIEAPQSKY